jgi:stage II sporulation protein D
VTIAARDSRARLRDARGAILNSTYFSVDRETRGRGRLAGLTLRGVGHGHGVGMCQWGAIGRSRAGADARAILRHYYPGTVVGFAD